MLTISLANPVPIHDQLVAGLRGLIAAAQLAEGDDLSPVRQLAADLGINLNAIARASGPKVEERKRIEAGITAALGDAKLAGLTREAS